MKRLLSSTVHLHVSKAWMYEQLANYYKYSNPQKHIEFYIKHYEEIQKLTAIYQQERSQSASVSVQPSKIRMLHASPNAPAVDIYINGQRILQNITFKQYSDYISLPQGQYRMDVYPTGTQFSPLFSAIVPIKGEGYIYTIATAGDVAKLQLLSFVDNTHLPYGKAKIRFIHLSPDAPAVDLALKDNDILFPNIPFKQATEFLEVTPGSAHLDVHVAGMKNIILSMADVKVEANKTYDIYAIGFTNKDPKLEALFLTN